MDLTRIRDAIESREFDSALKICAHGMKEHPEEKIAYILLAGHASMGKGEVDKAETCYTRVLEGLRGTVVVQGSVVDSHTVKFEAYNGLFEIYKQKGDVEGQVDALEHMLQVLTEEDPRDPALRIELGEKYLEMGKYEKSQEQLWHVLKSLPVGSEERLEYLCKMADSMLKQKELHVEEVVEKIQSSKEESLPDDKPLSCITLDVMAAEAARDDALHDVGVSLNHVLSEIVETAPVSLKYMTYREQYLQRCLLRIFHYPPRSTERQQCRLAALRECVGILCRGGPCSSFAFEAAVWLLEEEEEITGGQTSVGGQEVGGLQALAGGVQAGAEGHIGQGRHATVAFAVENFSRRMYHQFPTNPTAKVLMTLMLRRHAMLSKHPVPQSERRQWEEMLENAMKDDENINCASGLKALAELHYENRHYQKAHDASLRGLGWLQERRDRGHESLTQAGLGLRLVLAKSLRRLKRLDEAEAQFKALAGWTSEGELAFSEMCGSTPTSIHQQSLRGIALVAVERGDLDAALSQYERILGKAALGRGPAEHWAHADYGWLLYQQPNRLDQARYHLEQAIHVSEEEGCAATDSQVGEHHYRLGQVYWALGGEFRKDKQYAYKAFFEAAQVEGHAQGAALAALGRYYEEIEQNYVTAQRCFKKALSIDPSLNIAGELLCRHLLKQGKTDEEIIQFCSALYSKHTDAVWAYREIGGAELRLKHWDKAIAPLLKAVKLDKTDAMSWENLGLAYFNLGKIASATKALDRAIQLDARRTYARVILSWIQVHVKTSENPNSKHIVDSSYEASPLVHFSKAYSLYREASYHMMKGAIRTAEPLLASSQQHVTLFLQADGTNASAFKLLGDAMFLKQKINTLISVLDYDGESITGFSREAWEDSRTKIRRAYSKAIHLAPSVSPMWCNICLSLSSHFPKKYLDDVIDRPIDDTYGEALLAPQDTIDRCLRASLRLHPNSSESWRLLGAFLANKDTERAKYCLIRALQLDKKDFMAWHILYTILDEGSMEKGYCRQQAQSCKEDNSVDPWSYLLASKCSETSDIATRMNVVDVFGPELMELYMQNAFKNKTSPDASMSFSAAKVGACLDPLNPDLLTVLCLASLRTSGKTEVPERLQHALGDWLPPCPTDQARTSMGREQTECPQPMDAPPLSVGMSNADEEESQRIRTVIKAIHTTPWHFSKINYLHDIE